MGVEHTASYQVSTFTNENIVINNENNLKKKRRRSGNSWNSHFSFLNDSRGKLRTLVILLHPSSSLEASYSPENFPATEIAFLFMR